MKRGSAVGVAEAGDAPTGPLFEQLRGWGGVSGGAEARTRRGAASSGGNVGEGCCVRHDGTGAGSHLRRGANLVRVELRDGGYERLGVLHGVHDLLFPCFIEGAHGRRSRRARQCGSTEKLLKPSRCRVSSAISRSRLSRSRQQLIQALRTPRRALTAQPSPASTSRPPSMSAALCRAHVVAAAAPLTRRRQVASRGKVRPPPDPMCHAGSLRMLFHFQTPLTSPDRAPTPPSRPRPRRPPSSALSAPPARSSWPARRCVTPRRSPARRRLRPPSATPPPSSSSTLTARWATPRRPR